ncbi:hypothetical protein SCG7086_AL_00200 [Chlamydiales bacterium SCGC AG-110-P3]|nr:hypothetical protein SCG7086_AL_00200 [Chlamydiales bacterium SCGC AG-110-P3]
MIPLSNTPRSSAPNGLPRPPSALSTAMVRTPSFINQLQIPCDPRMQNILELNNLLWKQVQTNGKRHLVCTCKNCVTTTSSGHTPTLLSGSKLDLHIAQEWNKSRSNNPELPQQNRQILGSMIDSSLRFLEDRAAIPENLITRTTLLPKGNLNWRLTHRTRYLVATYIEPIRARYHQGLTENNAHTYSFLEGALKITFTATEILFHKAVIGAGTQKEVIKLKNFDTNETKALLQIKNTHDQKKVKKIQKQMANEYKLLKLFQGVEGIAQLSRVTLMGPSSLRMGSTGFIMNYYNSGDLQSYIKRSRSQLTNHVKGDICYQLANGLLAMHLKGIYHGDIKLQNIFVSVKSRDSKVKVALGDFGYSRTKPSLSGFRGFTANYVSPELAEYLTTVPSKLDQDNSQPVHGDLSLRQSAAKIDVWALGVTFFKLTHCKHPYQQLNTVPPNTDPTTRQRAFLKNVTKMKSREWQKKNTSIGDLDTRYLMDEITYRMLDPNPNTRPNIREVSRQMQVILSSIKVNNATLDNSKQ